MGNRVSKSYQEAEKWFRKSAEEGFAEAQLLIGSWYHIGQVYRESENNAFRWYYKAARQGLSNAEFMVGICYLEGTGTAKNRKQAKSWFEKAERAGHIEAKYYLERMKQNSSKSDEHASGQSELSSITSYLSGGKTDMDEEEILRRFKLLAEQDIVIAQYTLAELYYNTERTGGRKLPEAIKWFTKAAEQGHLQSQMRLGLIYCTEQNAYLQPETRFETGKKWLAKAAAQGDEKAQKLLDAIEILLDPED